MADILNLRQARKLRQRRQAAEAAAVNRLQHGLSKPEKAKAGSERARILAELDGARRVSRSPDGRDAPESQDGPGQA